jgi:deoxyribodipyrimidine photo-lyase
MKKNVLYWFKTDLRLHDNESLSEALSKSENIYFVYVHDPNMNHVTSFGTKKMGAFRQSFLNECLMDLDEQLKALNHSLIIFSGDAADELTQFCTEKNISDVYTQTEHFPEEKARVHDVRLSLQKENISLHTAGERTLLSQKDLPFHLNDLPKSFTPFRQKVESTWKIRSCAEIPNLASISTNEIDLNNYKISPSAEKEIRTAIPFKGGETAALARLHEYLYQTHKIQQYKETRNGLIGPDYSSKFSLWLAHGALSPRMIYHQIKAYEQKHGANESTYWMIFELLWRDYFHFAMQKTGSQLFQWSGVQTENRPPIPLNKEKFEKWRKL